VHRNELGFAEAFQFRDRKLYWPLDQTADL